MTSVPVLGAQPIKKLDKFVRERFPGRFFVNPLESFLNRVTLVGRFLLGSSHLAFVFHGYVATPITPWPEDKTHYGGFGCIAFVIIQITPRIARMAQ